MARHNIQFKGIRHAPSDITGQDGDLLECVNLVHEGGELKPIEMPEKVSIKGLWDNETLVAVHNLTDGKKYVFAVWNTVTSYIHIKDGDNNAVFDMGIAREEILWAETIGNTLIIGTDKSTHYALYKNGQYKWLGDKLPRPVFEFDFKRDSETHDGWTPTSNGYVIESAKPNIQSLLSQDVELPGGGLPLHLDVTYDMIFSISFEVDENKKRLREWIKAHIADVVHKAGSANVFIFPFLIRYAVRMFDGNYAMHSAPILMLPSTTKALMAYLVSYCFNDDTTNDKIYYTSHPGMIFRGMEMIYKFKGFVNENGAVADISDWEDIVKGVDLFLSSQIHSIDYDYLDRDDGIPSTFYPYNLENIPEALRPTYGIHDFGYCYSQNNKFSWYNIFKNAYNLESATTPMTWHGNVWNISKFYDIPLPSLSVKSMEEKIKDVNLFYRVKKYDLDELKASWGDNYRRLSTEIETGLLNRIETLPLLQDDYISRCKMTGRVNYNYNQRLVLGNIKLQAPKWYQDAKRFEKEVFYFDFYFVIEKPEKTIVVRWDSMEYANQSDIGLWDFGHYIYYPDPDCKRVIIEAGNNIKVLQMHEHTGLHGAYAVMPDLKSLNEAFSGLPNWTEGLPTPSEDRYYQLQNTIAMSSVANPFHFPASNFKDIGRTVVLGIAANTLDVSSGQWGQYPLHVFCGDGIIAVTIDAEGKMGRIDAVSADVLRVPRGLSQPTLIQTNQMLVFLTQRGVMSIAGTRPQPLSLVMEGRHFNPMSDLDGVDYRVGAFANMIGRTSDSTAFRDFAASGFLAYDYAHHRVLLLRPDRDYQYVLSMDTMMWSKQIVYTNLASYQLDAIPSNTLQERDSIPLLQVQPITAAVNNYTELYLQDTDGWLYKTMDVQGENSVKQLYQYGYFISRPVRFGTDAYKSIVRVLHEYTHYASKSFVKMALYGSRDGVKYGRLNTLRGMGYKYFIFVVYTYLKPNERYSYLRAEIEERLDNKLR